jgi:hypothetical protein
MGWAIRGALAAAELLPQGAEGIRDDIGLRWQVRFEDVVRRRQAWCRGLRHLLGNDMLAGLGVQAARIAPWGARRIAQRISAG